MGSNDAGADGRSVGVRLDECGNGLDDDGNGAIDDGCPCAPGERQRCFSGALSSNEVGACASGTQTCDVVSGSEWGDWGLSDCVGEVVAATEACDGTDADCDGAIDEGCPCMTGMDRSCGEEFVSAPCRAGTQSCRGGTWSSCEGAIGPTSDVCEDAIDNDCDGMTNEGCDCAYPPTPERCRDGVDNDCDGVTDEPECTPDWPACDGTLAPPRLVAPLSGSLVTSPSPTLRWELPPGTTGAIVERCADPDCATILDSVSVATTYRPSTPWPVGPTFWRTRGTVGDRASCATSPTWELFVSHADTPVDTSQGYLLDINRDGAPDLMTGGQRDWSLSAMLPDAPVRVILGGASPRAVDLPANATTFQTLGDVDGDGFGDVALGMIVDGAQTIRVMRGGADGLRATPLYEIRDIVDMTSGVGDYDGDGYGDITYVRPVREPGGGGGLVGLETVLLFGSADWSAPDLRVHPAPVAEVFPSTHNAFLHRAGDVNGDGLADLVLSRLRPMCALSSACDPWEYRAVVMYGTPDRSWREGALLHVFPEVSHFPLRYAREAYIAGDLNGDGFGDILLAWPQGRQTGIAPNQSAFVHYGSASGIGPENEIANLEWGTELVPGLPFQRSVTATRLGDVNGDGIEDIELYTRLRLGTTAGVGPPTTLLPNRCYDGWSAACHAAGAGDLDGDGLDDVVLLDPVAPSSRISIARGTSGGLAPAVPFGPDQPFAAAIAGISED